MLFDYKLTLHRLCGRTKCISIDVLVPDLCPASQVCRSSEANVSLRLLPPNDAVDIILIGSASVTNEQYNMLQSKMW